MDFFNQYEKEAKEIYEFVYSDQTRLYPTDFVITHYKFNNSPPTLSPNLPTYVSIIEHRTIHHFKALRIGTIETPIIEIPNPDDLNDTILFCGLDKDGNPPDFTSDNPNPPAVAFIIETIDDGNELFLAEIVYTQSESFDDKVATEKSTNILLKNKEENPN